MNIHGMMKLFKNRIPFLLGLCMLGACASPDMPQGIPEFSMVLPDTTQVFHSKDIPFGKITVLIQFDPACRDCQEETEYILANMNDFKNANFYLVTKHSYKEMMIFHDHLKLDTCKNLRIGIDETGVIPKEFHIRSTPITLVFNKDKMLKAAFAGKPDMEKLKQIINEQS